MIERALGNLLAYAREQGLIDPADTAYARNRALEVLRIRDYDPSAETSETSADIDDLLRPLLDDAADRGLIAPDTVAQRDLWDTAIMGCFLPYPSQVAQRFRQAHAVDPRAATDAFHRESVASNYIRVGRTDRNVRWRQGTRYGVMDMTINVSKPEKDPRDIAAAADARPAGGYPQCLLCRENEGYAGRADHPARQNLRLIPMTLGGQPWFLQYSPYRYYTEHCIVLSEEHRPMEVTPDMLTRLADCVDLLPHYLVGSNADLPIVGGSILSHDHFQGGRYEFAMDRAAVLQAWERGTVRAEVLDWPLAVVRLTGPRPEVHGMACDILAAWRGYSDQACGVLAATGSQPHNTITPIARRQGLGLRLDLVLRNNRTTDQYPDGVFHPHAQIHPVKRENIGLIEVLGLAVLPGRLATELAAIGGAVAAGGDLPPNLAAHAPMAEQIRRRAPESISAPDAVALARQVAGEYFVQGLMHCGVFGAQPLAGMTRFLAASDIV